MEALPEPLLTWAGPHLCACFPPQVLTAGLPSWEGAASRLLQAVPLSARHSVLPFLPGFPGLAPQSLWSSPSRLPASCVPSAPPVLATPAMLLPLPFLVRVTITTTAPSCCLCGLQGRGWGSSHLWFWVPSWPCVFSEFLALQRPQLATPAGLPRLACRVRACVLRHFGHV